jgi:two-component system response regulator DevR
MNARVALIDPHEAVRIGLTYVLQPLGISVRASLASTCEFHQSQPDVDIVILDVPEKERSEVRHLTAEIRKSVPMVIIHTARSPSLRWPTSDSHLSFVSKETGTRQLVKAVLLAQRSFADESSRGMAVNQPVPESRPVLLPPREKRALQLYASNLPLKSVAFEMGISLATVREYLARTKERYRQAGQSADSKLELYLRAVQDGLVEVPSGPNMSKKGVQS